jgi:hypothetical protein
MDHLGRDIHEHAYQPQGYDRAGDLLENFFSHIDLLFPDTQYKQNAENKKKSLIDYRN